MFPRVTETVLVSNYGTYMYVHYNGWLKENYYALGRKSVQAAQFN